MIAVGGFIPAVARIAVDARQALGRAYLHIGIDGQHHGRHLGDKGVKGIANLLVILLAMRVHERLFIVKTDIGVKGQQIAVKALKHTFLRVFSPNHRL